MYIITANVQAHGQAGFTALNFGLTVPLVASLNFEKPPCPLVPCSALLCDFDHLTCFVTGLFAFEFLLMKDFVLPLVEEDYGCFQFNKLLFRNDT